MPYKFVRFFAEHGIFRQKSAGLGSVRQRENGRARILADHAHQSNQLHMLSLAICRMILLFNTHVTNMPLRGYVPASAQEVHKPMYTHGVPVTIIWGPFHPYPFASKHHARTPGIHLPRHWFWPKRLPEDVNPHVLFAAVLKRVV